MEKITSENSRSPIPHFPVYRGPFVWKWIKKVQNSPTYRGSPFIETPLIEVPLYHGYSTSMTVYYLYYWNHGYSTSMTVYYLYYWNHGYSTSMTVYYLYYWNHGYSISMKDLLPYMTELFPSDNDMKPYNTTLSSYSTNDNHLQRFLCYF